MTIRSKSRRRLAVLALLSVITLAGGSFLRTAVERELVPQSAVLRFWAVASPLSEDREFYRLAADTDDYRVEARHLLGQATPAEEEAVIEHLLRRRGSLLNRFEAFVEAHPLHVTGLRAHADLLLESGAAVRSLAQWERAAELSKDDPRVWKELADRAVHLGDMSRAFMAYEHALRADPENLEIIQALSTALFVYRADAMQRYDITEAEVFDRSLDLLKHAAELFPKDIAVAVELAESYYTVKPPRDSEAIGAWARVQEMVETEHQRQEASLHMARFMIRRGHREKAENVLARVTLPAHSRMRNRVESSLLTVTSKAEMPEAIQANFDNR